jgi:hypothetical protein
MTSVSNVVEALQAQSQQLREAAGNLDSEDQKLQYLHGCHQPHLNVRQCNKEETEKGRTKSSSQRL